MLTLIDEYTRECLAIRVARSQGALPALLPPIMSLDLVPL